MRVAILFISASLIACGDGGDGGGGGGDDQPPTEIDPTQVDPTESDALYCPPPDHPRVHYLSMEHSACSEMVIRCSVDQNGFDNPCGCGCIDKGDAICPGVFDEAITWISIDPADCDSPPDCRLGDTPFDNSCGCGCT